MRLPNLTSMIGMEPVKNGVATFLFKSTDGRTHYVPIKIGALNGVVTPFLMAARELLNSDGGSVSAQALTLQGAREAIDEQGTPVLELRLDGLPVFVALPEGSIPAMINILSELQRKSSGPSNPVRH